MMECVEEKREILPLAKSNREFRSGRWIFAQEKGRVRKTQILIHRLHLISTKFLTFHCASKTSFLAGSCQRLSLEQSTVSQILAFPSGYSHLPGECASISGHRLRGARSQQTRNCDVQIFVCALDFLNEYDDNPTFKRDEYIRNSYFSEDLKIVCLRVRRHPTETTQVTIRHIIARYRPEFVAVGHFNEDIEISGLQFNIFMFSGTQMATAQF